MTKIEWTHRPGTQGESWNFIGGCSKVSPGCDSCYALSMSWRLQNMEKRPKRYEGVVESTIHFDPPVLYHEKQGRIKWTGRVNLDWDALEAPYRWKKPRTVFVQSMGDLFHEKVSAKFIIKAFKAMRDNPEHRFLVLTKRAERMHRFIRGFAGSKKAPFAYMWRLEWPFPNVWLGVTAENQEQADKRIPLLLQTPAAVRWVSVEPMLGAIVMQEDRLFGNRYLTVEANELAMRHSTEQDHAVHCQGHRAECLDCGQTWVTKEGLDWVVIGAESGPNRRLMKQSWAIDLVKQCDAARIPVFVKQIQLGTSRHVSKLLDGHVLDQYGDTYGEYVWPAELRRREWPR